MTEDSHCHTPILKTAPKILVVEQLSESIHLLRQLLSRLRAVANYCTGPREAYQYLKTWVPDLLLLSSCMEQEDPVTFCRDFRRIYPWVPILVLAQENNLEQRIAFLDSGADDCLVQPVEPDELMARVRRGLMRFHELYDYYQMERTSCELDAIGLTMNPDKWQASFKGVLMDLSKTEFKLLELFCVHPNETLARSILVQKVWRAKPPSSPRTIDNFVMRLRKKLSQVLRATDTDQNDVQLITVHGLGYQLRVRKLKGQQQRLVGV